jgi:hypothetical protein
MTSRTGIALIAAATILAIPTAARPAGATGTASPTTATTSPRAAVIAVVGESGMNVLHQDFATTNGRDPAYAAGLPRLTTVTLPSRGTFEQRRAQLKVGPLGHLRPGVVYAVRGTRLLIVSAPSARPITDVTGSQTRVISTSSTDPTLHGTGVVDAAIGRRFGTAPAALAILVLGPPSDAWAWVARERWVDLATTSDYDAVPGCTAVDSVRSIVGSGRLVFSSSGNTTDAGEPLTAPNGLPEVYQVGGVDRDGAPYLPPHQDADPWFAAGTVTRPYETGELYDFTTASQDSLTGTMRFGGTSGATPRTAGWAADLLMWTWRHAVARPPRGPLADGRLTGSELTRLLHAVARPSMPSGDGGFLLEGYGALGAEAAQQARRVLAGSAPEPRRPEDDARQARVDQARQQVFSRCALS